MISACKKTIVLDNINNITGFIQNKQVLSEVNSSSLINLLKVYFETLLYYKANSPAKFLIKINNETFEVKFNGKNAKGERICKDFIEAQDSLIDKVFKSLSEVINKESFENLQKCLISILGTDSIETIDKVMLLNGDNNLFHDTNERLFYNINETVALNSVNRRIEVLYECLIHEDNRIQVDDAEVLYKKLFWCFELYLKNCINRNNLIEGVNFLQDELTRIKNVKNKELLNEKTIVSTILDKLVSFNLLFQLQSNEHIKETVDDYKKYLPKETTKIIYENIKFNPNKFSIENIDIELLTPDFQDVVDNQVLTMLIFTVQLEDDI